MAFRSALVIGASGGIGSALCDALRADGTEVVGLSRSADGLDVTDAASVGRALSALDGPFDLIFVATGALVVNDYTPEKAIEQVEELGLTDLFRLNAMGPMLVLKHGLPLLVQDGRAVFAALSARVGSIGDNGIGGWHGYRASKAALNQFLHGAAIELKRTHPEAICLALHPGTVETPLTAKYAGRHKTVTAEQAASNLLSVLRDATPDHSGGFYDYAFEEIPW